MTVLFKRSARAVCVAGLCSLVLGLSLTLGCTSVCDQDGLQRAAEAFAADGAERRRAGLAALQKACPTMPEAFSEGLVADARHIDDPAWHELLARTCLPVPAPATPITLEMLEVDVRRVCDLDRHGLLAPEATFARRDVVVFMLFEWLLAGRVDRARATEVVLPLLTASTLAAQDLTPPQSTSDLPQRDGLELRISPTTLYVEGDAVLPLVRGRAATDAFAGHISPKLRGALVEAVRRGRVRAERAGAVWRARVSVLADRATPMITILDAVYTASRVGFTAFELLVHDGDELRGLPFSVNYALPPPDDEEPREKALDLLYVVHAESVEVSTATQSTPGRSPGTTYSWSCAANSVDCRDLADLVAHEKKLKSLFPNEVVATYHVDGDVTLQVLVALLDRVRGEGCELIGPYQGEAMPEECLFWRSVLDLHPPLDDRLNRHDPIEDEAARE